MKAFGDDINEGDLFLHNDPYTGGTHLNDVLLLQPIFLKVDWQCLPPCAAIGTT